MGCPGYTIVQKYKTTNWILPIGVDGFDNKKTSNWKIHFDNFVNKGRGVKSSFKEESDSSMNIKNASALEH